VIEAERYLKGATIPDGVILTGAGTAFIRTLEGDMEVSPGDWIITGIANERYPCKAHIFEATYEPILVPRDPE